MRILFVSTLSRNVSPRQFASRSRIIYQLSSELAKKNHAVTLLGTGDSEVPGVNIIPLLPKGWSDLPPVENDFLRKSAFLLQLTRKIEEIQDEFDIIHNHTYPDFFPMVSGNRIHVPLVTTLHALAADYIDDTLPLFPGFHYVALSQAYKKLYKKSHLEYVVYNGVDPSLYAYFSQKKDYVLWLGRLPMGKNKDGTFMDPKGVREAISAVRSANVSITLGGAVEDRNFFEKDVEPYLSSNTRWMGNVNAQQSIPVENVVSTMQQAKAFLMTVNQEEPFGLVMIESMACGTPVIAFAKGSVPEVVQDGVTGYIVNASDDDIRGDWIIKKTGVEGLKEAIERIYALSAEEYTKMSRACRDRVEKYFTVEKMVDGYEKVYATILEKKA